MHAYRHVHAHSHACVGVRRDGLWPLAHADDQFCAELSVYMRHFCATEVLVDEETSGVPCSAMYWLLDGEAEAWLDNCEHVTNRCVSLICAACC